VPKKENSPVEPKPMNYKKSTSDSRTTKLAALKWDKTGTSYKEKKGGRRLSLE